MLSREEILQRLHEYADEMQERFSLRRIGLFGSYVRGSADEESDIDLLIKLNEPTFDHYMDLKFFLEDILHRSVDLVLAETVKPKLKLIITGEVIYA